jgi:hypothetical protein
VLGDRGVELDEEDQPRRGSLDQLGDGGDAADVLAAASRSSV